MSTLDFLSARFPQCLHPLPLMEHELLSHALQLTEVLAQGQYLSVAQLAELTQLHPRKIYRLLETLPKLGLTLDKSRHSYRINPESPFLKKVTSLLHFTPDEVLTLSQILAALPHRSVQVRLLREKLERYSTEQVLIPTDVDESTGRNIRSIFEAIEQERIVILKGYSSSQSQKRDRIVEPYAFLPGNREVRCYEIASDSNKTFNLSRADAVELVNLRWSYREKHRPLLVDLFHFSSETSIPVHLRLGVLAKSVLLDEYPQAETMLTPIDNTHWDFKTNVCSLKGIGRFVMGLLEDIEIVHAPELSAYLSEQLSKAALRFYIQPS